MKTNSNYRWFILGVCFLMLLINSGIVLSFGIFLPVLREQFAWTATHVSLVLASFMLMQGLFSPKIGSLIDRHGPRKVIIAGIIMFGVILAALSQINAFWQFAVLYGFLAAIAYTTTTLLTNAVLISGWFSENRGLALGISMSGFPLGPLFMTPVLTFFLLNYDWRTAILAAAGIVLVILFPLAFLLLRDGPGHTAIKNSLTQPDKQADSSPNWTILTLLSDPRYRRLAGAYFTCGFSMALIMAHFHNFGQNIGFDLATTAQAFSLMSLLAFIGTITSGKMSDILERKVILAIIYFVRGLSFIIFAFAASIEMFYLGATLFGIFWTATGPLTSALSGECWGLESMGKTFGAVFLGHQIGASIGPILGGMSFDATGSYRWIFLFTALILISGSLAVKGLNVVPDNSPSKSMVFCTMPSANGGQNSSRNC
ncbi:MFS transporter [Dethiobacter alkaliphilus]|uniref:MFS transporter n=1 Tax=Dethiobacter alkaliphilus TaxID=427926 RepID=UPI002226FDEB|nr:MFS transporter [Dethiobacter alkaliphilus]MCW3491697.1 MFS transporter [Dethiobacter alkaliphilus]